MVLQNLYSRRGKAKICLMRGSLLILGTRTLEYEENPP